MYHATRMLLKGLQETFAPARCIVCLRAGRWLCLTCWSEALEHYPSLLSCVGCGTTATSQGLMCAQCRRTTPLLGVVSAGSYHTPYLQRGIHWLKFKGVQAVASALAQLLVPRLLLIAPLTDLRERALLLPIPLHSRRQRERGFNQSALLAAQVSALTGIPWADVLLRQRATWAQSQLPVELRAENIQNSFVMSPHAPRTPPDMALIIDDVTTSGATLRAAAHVLAAAGWQQVWGLTIARG